jgi:geranylgeranyl diphosphate synthase type II
MNSILSYTKRFNSYLEQNLQDENPKGLFEPINYILNLGGKRIRPALVLMSADLFEAPAEEALDAAMAVEVFHNFSLVHDDIMDDAPLRRQQPTVHEKWDLNTAILSGDAMLIWAYQCFESYDQSLFMPLIKLFSKTAREVCIGQQYDMDFEVQSEVKIEDYLEMIRLKTAVLVACAFQMGGIIAKTSVENQDKLYQFGESLGLAFQIQDDLLDIYGNPEVFGKQIGGDIIENKKTYLYLKALELSSENDKNQLKHLYSISPKNTKAKIETVRLIFDNYEVKEESAKQIKFFTEKALDALQNLEITDVKKENLRIFAEELMQRNV